ncbi:MAG: hypothetical protein WC511_02275 [Candidatus Pacearchaeota archaeon]
MAVFLDAKGNLKVKKVSSKAFVGPLAGAVTLPSYTVATVPAAASMPGALIYVSNGAGGIPCLAISTGSAWLVAGPIGSAISAS